MVLWVAHTVGHRPWRDKKKPEESRSSTGSLDRILTRVVVQGGVDQQHAPFYGQDALRLPGRRLERRNQTRIEGCDRTDPGGTRAYREDR